MTLEIGIVQAATHLSLIFVVQRGLFMAWTRQLFKFASLGLPG
jgi:hypothetical protein